MSLSYVIFPLFRLFILWTRFESNGDLFSFLRAYKNYARETREHSG